MAVRYWVSGGTGAWNSTTNWSTASGGSSGASVPISTDSVVFDANSGTGNITIVAATTVAAVTITACSALTIISGATYAFSCTGTMLYNSGTFTFEHTGGITLSVLTISSGLSSGILTFNNTGSVVVSSTTTYNGGDITFSNTTSVQLNSFTSALAADGTGTFLVYNGTTFVTTGTMTFNGGNVVIGNSTNVTLNALTVSANDSFNTLQVNNYGTFTINGAFTYNGGFVDIGSFGTTATLSSTLLINSAASNGSIQFSNSGAVSVAGTFTFTSSGAGVTFSNGTSVSLAAVTVNGSSGDLYFSNGTTLALSGTMSVTTAGINVYFQNGTNTTLTTLTVNATSSGGSLNFQNSGTIAASVFNYNVTSLPGTTVLFDYHVTTITLSGVAGLNINSAYYFNVTFNCATLTLTGVSSSLKAGPCNMTCTVNINGGVTLTSDLYTTGQLNINAACTLGGYRIDATAAYVNAAVTWNTSSNSKIVLHFQGYFSTYILQTGASFTKTIIGGSEGYFILNLGSSSFEGNAASIYTNSAGDEPNIYVTKDYSGVYSYPMLASLTCLPASAYLGKVTFNDYNSTFTATTLYVSGNLTFTSDMTFVCSTALYFVGTTSFTNAGQSFTNIMYVGIANGASGTLTLLEDVTTTAMFRVNSGTLNLNDHVLTCSKAGFYDGISGHVVTNTINAGTGQTGTIIMRTLGVQTGAPTWTIYPTYFSNYTGSGSSYVLTNNPTFIIEPTSGGGTGQFWIYNNDLQGSLIVKNALDNVTWNFDIGYYSATKAMFTNFTIVDGFAGTVDVGPYEIYGNLYIGNSVTLSSSTSGFTFITPTTSTKTITVGSTASFLRPIDISGASATAITQLLSNVSINKTLTLNTGKLDLNNYSFTANAFDSSVAGTRVIGFGTSGKIVTTGTGTVYNTVATITYTGTSRIEINNATATAATVATGTNTSANSLNFYIKAGTYTLTLSGTVRDIDFTGYTGSGAIGTDFTMHGNLILSSGMTMTTLDTRLLFSGTGTQYITTNNVLVKRALLFNGTGTYVLQDSLTQSGSFSSAGCSHSSGTLDLNGNTLTVAAFSSIGAVTRNLTWNSGTIYVTGSGTQAFYTNSVFTASAGNGPGFVYMTSSTAKTFANASGAPCVYYTTLVQAGSGLLSITGAANAGHSTFTNLKNSVVPANITITSNVTLTFTDNFQLKGSPGALVTLTSTVATTAANVSLASGTVTCDYLSLKDSRATGGASWSAGNHSVNVSNNTGWYFTAAATANPQMMMLFPL